MAIINYPENIFRTARAAIDVAMSQGKTYTYQYSQDITSSAMNNVLSADRNWTANSILLNFSSATARNFAVSIIGGRKVVEKYNDYLWFQCTSSVWQKIILTPGFYTGTQLAAHLESLLNTNAAFTALSLTFTVTYSATTGLFTITPSSGQIRYLQTNNSQVLGLRDSIAGNLFGLNADTAFASSVVSDTANIGLTSSSAIFTLTGNTATSYLYTTPISLSIDQAINLTTNTAALSASVNINYSLNY